MFSKIFCMSLINIIDAIPPAITIANNRILATHFNIFLLLLFYFFSSVSINSYEDFEASI